MEICQGNRRLKQAAPGAVRTGAPAPVSDRERIFSLDVLRGGAAGILPMNIQSFSTIAAAYMNPTAVVERRHPDLMRGGWIAQMGTRVSGTFDLQTNVSSDLDC